MQTTPVRIDPPRYRWRVLGPAGLVAVVGLASAACAGLMGAGDLLTGLLVGPGYDVDLCGLPLHGLGRVWSHQSGPILLALAGLLAVGSLVAVVLAVHGARARRVAVVALLVLALSPLPWLLEAQRVDQPLTCTSF